MPIPLLIPLISGATSAVGGMAKRKKAGEERRRITKWSPWTGLTPPEREKGSAISDLIKGGAAGMKLAKGLGPAGKAGGSLIPHGSDSANRGGVSLGANISPFKQTLKAPPWMKMAGR